MCARGVESTGLVHDSAFAATSSVGVAQFADDAGDIVMGAELCIAMRCSEIVVRALIGRFGTRTSQRDSAHYCPVDQRIQTNRSAGRR